MTAEAALEKIIGRCYERGLDGPEAAAFALRALRASGFDEVPRDAPDVEALRRELDAMNVGGHPLRGYSKERQLGWDEAMATVRSALAAPRIDRYDVERSPDTETLRALAGGDDAGGKR